MSDPSRPVTPSSREKKHDYLESLMNPRNDAEYILAVTIPGSPLQKEFVTQLVQAETENLVLRFDLIKLIEVIINHMARDKEGLIRDELKSQEKMKEYQQQLAETQKTVEQHSREIKKSDDPDALAKLKQQLTEQNQELQERLSGLESRLSELRSEIVTIKDDCLASQKAVTDAAINSLVDVTYVAMNGAHITFDRDSAEALRDMLTTPTLDQHHKINRGLFDRLADAMVEGEQDLEHFASVACNTMMDLVSVLNPLKLIGYLEGDDRPTGAALLKHLKAAGSTSLVNACTLMYQTSDRETNTRCMGNCLDQSVCESDLKKCRSEMRSNNQLVAVIDARSSELKHAKEAVDHHVPEAPPAPEAPEPPTTSWRLPTPHPGGRSKSK